MARTGLWTTPAASDGTRGGKITPAMSGSSLAQQVRTPERWPTPRANDGQKRGAIDPTNPRNGLPAAVLSVPTWPTPTASLGNKGGRITPRKGREGGTLIEAVASRMFPTPISRDHKSGKASASTMEKNSRPLSEVVGSETGGGLLSPDWVEWLMGYPIGWTALPRSAMPSSRKSRRSSGARSSRRSAGAGGGGGE